MQSEWADFMERDVSPRAPHVQIMEMRKAFYAGMASGLKLAMLRTTQVNLREMKEYIAAEDRRRTSDRGEKRGV